jgi:hypothetical protein
VSHDPEWHLLAGEFTGSDDGLIPPTRNLGSLEGLCLDVALSPFDTRAAHSLRVAPGGLQITNLDRSDPPGYLPGSYPRSAKFNRNVISLRASGGMPRIRVRCALSGVGASRATIYWRLQCLHLLCRHKKTTFPYRYTPLCKRFYHEWQGRSVSDDFTLFDPADASVAHDLGGGPNGPVMGGHAILSVAARVPGMRAPLVDYAHLRIVGANPTELDRVSHLNTVLSGRDENILNIIRAIFAHESGGLQFDSQYYSRRKMKFTKKFHPHPPCDESQTDCEVYFRVPADPAYFPKAAFDFGVGISQYTEVGSQVVSPSTAWDWRENVAKGVNLVFEKMKAQYAAGITWKTWAWKSWKSYNGSGAAAVAYANTLAASPEGLLVSTAVVPPLSQLQGDLAPLVEQSPTAASAMWPPI